MMMEKGKALSTIKVYLAATSACHVGLEGKVVRQHPLVHAVRSLCWTHFLLFSLGLLDQVDFKMVTLKMVLASAKRVGEIHALSVNQTCMKFPSENTGMALPPHPVYMPRIFDPWITSD